MFFQSCPKLNILFIAILFFAIPSYANEFLNTPDDAMFFEVQGDGNEAGFFTLVKFVVDEDKLPKQSLIPSEEEIDAELLFQKLLLLEPQIVILENSAKCRIDRGPYYNLNDLISRGTEVTFSYLFKTDAFVLGASCKVQIFVLGESSPRKTIQYYTKR